MTFIRELRGAKHIPLFIGNGGRLPTSDIMSGNFGYAQAVAIGVTVIGQYVDIERRVFIGDATVINALWSTVFLHILQINLKILHAAAAVGRCRLDINFVRGSSFIIELSAIAHRDHARVAIHGKRPILDRVTIGIHNRIGHAIAIDITRGCCDTDFGSIFGILYDRVERCIRIGDHTDIVVYGIDIQRQRAGADAAMPVGYRITETRLAVIVFIWHEGDLPVFIHRHHTMLCVLYRNNGKGVTLGIHVISE